jgi:DNA-binding transcriptional MerR regulator
MSKKQTVKADEDLSLVDAAEIAGVSVRTVQRWVKAGLLESKARSFGSVTYSTVSRLKLEAYLKKSPDRAE